MSYEDGMPAGGNSRFRGYPARMSERQQLALLLQMTSQETVSSSGTGGNRTNSIGTHSTSRSLSLQHSQRGSKGRWSNKNGDSPINQTLQNRKEDYRGRSTLNGYDSSANEANEAASTSPPEGRTLGQDVSRSPSRTSSNATTSVQSDREGDRGDNCQHHDHQNQQRTDEGSLDATTLVADDSGAPCEMRRTSPQNKVDRSGPGQSGSSPRVTLRLNQVRSSRDDKKSGPGNLRQSVSSAASQGHMETLSKTSNSAASSSSSSPAISTIGISGNALSSSAGSGHGGTGCGLGGAGGGASAATIETGDVYEFKSSKEATPVRGASASPNLDKENDKEKESSKSMSGGQGTGSGPASGSTGTTSSSESAASSLTGGAGNESHASGSPSSKRSYEGDNADEQEDESRKKKKKESEVAKEPTKGPGSGRQNAGRNAIGTGDKCTKAGKQSFSSGVSGKSGQGTIVTNPDRKSPGATSAASSSPKPSGSSSSSMTNSKIGIPALAESDGEDDRPRSSDSGSAPKVPPLKIVIPQSTTSEQEVGARNGKNTTNRSHQLPYVVPSSNSNDSTDKDQTLTASGTASPTEVGNSAKNEDKKDFTGVLHSEERSTHHQRVLRSSHRTGNGGNGLTTSKDSGAAPSANGNYSHSSPVPATSSTDRSNNSSPQQQQQASSQQQQIVLQPQQQPSPQQQQQNQQQEHQQQEQEQQQQQQQQQRHNSPGPEATNADTSKTSTADSTPSSSSSGGNSNGNGSNTAKASATSEKAEKSGESNGKSQKDGGDTSETAPSSASTTAANTSGNATAPVELHPRKRKMKPSKEAQQAAATASANESSEAASAGPEVHPHDQPITNCYQLFLNIRKQIERRRKGLFPVQPKPPQGFKDYLMNRCTYVLAGNANKEPNINPPVALQGPMKDLYVEQEKERYRLRMQHVVEKEKLVLSVEQEILRVHGRAARALANQSLPFSVCTILKDEEVYNVITPEQEEKDRNARSRYNGRLFLSWLQDVDDKWEKIKEAMLLRHHNEAESLHAVQRMDWEWKLKEVGLCEFKATPQIEDIHVPMVHVSDDFDLLPA